MLDLHLHIECHIIIFMLGRVVKLDKLCIPFDGVSNRIVCWFGNQHTSEITMRDVCEVNIFGDRRYCGGV